MSDKNTGYRPYFWPSNSGKLPTMGGPVGVLDLCVMLHEAHNGSAPDHSKDEIDNAVKCL